MTRTVKFLFPALILLMCLVMGCAQKPPTIASISPSSGPSGGGTKVTISGKNFKQGATVTIGGVTAKDIVIDPKGLSATVTTPGGPPGTVQVVANNPKAKEPSLPVTFVYEELKVASTNPADTAQVPWEPPLTQVSVEFSQDIQPDSAVITIEGVTGTVSYDAAKRTATFTASEPLKTGSSYSAKVSGAKDLANNVMPDHTFGFSVEKKPVDETVKWYTVEEGDTLPIIAGKVYGDEGKWTLIYQWNQDEFVSEDGKHHSDAILDYRHLTPGTTLYIPR